MAAFAQLYAAGYLDGSVCEPGQDRLAYETENEGMGWYYFHHHHFHVSISEPSQGSIQYRECLNPYPRWNLSRVPRWNHGTGHSNSV